METIGDFEYNKKDLIGHGAFAVVFKGRHRKKTDFTVAIKCITKKNLAKSQNLLSKEIKILKELSDLQHENVVTLLDCKETSHHVYLVMEYCNGGDLADFLQAKGTLSEDTIASFLRQIAGAMKALVAKGIVHRDIKPQNILLCHPSNKQHSKPAEMKLKIADFGFARFLQDGVMAATLCGSPMYMAPEVIMSIQYDAKADLWSIGTIIYQCLTGKAPFQAQTPQQLKMFYERNANLQPNIPPGTSPELRDLLLKLLRRNAKDRISFEDFFRHPFIFPHKSSPVAVPTRRQSHSSVGESPPLKTIGSSPLSGHVFSSSPRDSPPKTKDQAAAFESMDIVSPPITPHPPHKAISSVSDESSNLGGVSMASTTRAVSPVEDYVIVPENLPSDHSAASIEAAPKPPTSVDLNAIFSNRSPESPRQTVRPQLSPSRSSLLDLPAQTTVSRPSTLPGVEDAGNANQSPVSATSTQPIPVPSQVKAYEKIQLSTGVSPSSPMAERSPSRESPRPEVGVPIPRKQSTGSVPSVGSLSPPSVQFSIGTPPSTTWKHSSTIPHMTPPGGSPSPHRRSVHRISTTPGSLAVVSGTSPLPTIMGSPTKVVGALQFTSPGEECDSPGSPLAVPFGSSRSRAKTCPDNIAAVGYSPDGNRTNKSLVPVSEPELYHKVSSNSRLSEQLIKAAFGATAPNTGLALTKQIAQNPAGNVIVPYTTSNTSLNHNGSNLSVNDLPEAMQRQRRLSANDEANTRRRTFSGGYYEDSPGKTMAFAQSPPNMEGPIMFVAPELAEETLMDKTHNDTVAKLNFVLALVECIIELAQSRSSPLSESIIEPSSNVDNQSVGSLFSLDHISFLSEGQRHIEQLVLYVRALQMLASSIQLAKEEIKAKRLQTSNSVKTILREMNDYFHQCLAVCRNLHNQGVSLNPEINPHAAAITADKLIYNYAIEMCQTAALDELFGNPQECFHRYRNAQILLHSLAQQAADEKDKELLNGYRIAVEKRLYNLHSQGLLLAQSTNNS